MDYDVKLSSRKPRVVMRIDEDHNDLAFGVWKRSEHAVSHPSSIVLTTFDAAAQICHVGPRSDTWRALCRRIGSTTDQTSLYNFKKLMIYFFPFFFFFPPPPPPTAGASSFNAGASVITTSSSMPPGTAAIPFPSRPRLLCINLDTSCALVVLYLSTTPDTGS